MRQRPWAGERLAARSRAPGGGRAGTSARFFVLQARQGRSTRARSRLRLRCSRRPCGRDPAAAALAALGARLIGPRCARPRSLGRRPADRTRDPGVAVLGARGAVARLPALTLYTRRLRASGGAPPSAYPTRGADGASALGGAALGCRRRVRRARAGRPPGVQRRDRRPGRARGAFTRMPSAPPCRRGFTSWATHDLDRAPGAERGAGAARHARPRMRAGRAREAIVVDGGSADATVAIARSFPGVEVIQAPRGRARQMNAGARVARGEWLVFLHADTLLPPDGLARIAALPGAVHAGASASASPATTGGSRRSRACTTSAAA